MGLKSKLRYVLNGAYNYLHIYNILESKKFLNERLYGELIRNVHSIEKGLSLAETRYGFGYKKITEAFNIAQLLAKEDSELYNEAIDMFADAVKMYLSFHKDHNYSDENVIEIESRFNEFLKCRISSQYCNGGVKFVKKRSYSSNEKDVINSLFIDRHSVREFTGENVDHDRLINAIQLAHLCPSACNRQGYRIHVIDKKGFSVFENWFDGIGGFTDQINLFIIITGKQSLYRREEELQYIVSASIYAGYLTLALQAEGIGCCFIQRPVVFNNSWKKISKQLDISDDEQVVCSLGLGCLKEEYKVPVSHRINLKNIVTFHD